MAVKFAPNALLVKENSTPITATNYLVAKTIETMYEQLFDRNFTITTS
jgi:hypothetical protein